MGEKEIYIKRGAITISGTIEERREWFDKKENKWMRKPLPKATNPVRRRSGYGRRN